jgi:multicomponent Na+:H+ antiporter subunit E
MTVRRTSLAQFVVLCAFWFALSGRSDPLFVVTGLVTAAAVTLVTTRLTRTSLRPDGARIPASRLPTAVVRALGFAAWMGWRILVASVQLAVIVLSPRMPLQPCTVRFRTSLTRPLARAPRSYAFSLVPGTLTVDIDGDLIVVHALSPHQLDDLVSGRLQNKVAAMFFEAPQSAVDPATIEEGDLP